nr:hypothetical protein BaRGS_030420 [Batillaria attramentaria]
MKGQLEDCLGYTTLLLILRLAVSSRVSVTKLDTYFIPSAKTIDGQPSYHMHDGLLCDLTFEPETKLIYAAGDRCIDVMDVSNPARLVKLQGQFVQDRLLHSISACGGQVFVTYSMVADELLDDGNGNGIIIYQSYSRKTKKMEKVKEIKFGRMTPSMVSSTPACTVVVAFANKPYKKNGKLVDPPGGIYILRPKQNLAGKMLKFDNFANRFEQLSESRVNNAIAEVDLVNDQITAIHGLGLKHWTKVDPSDMDDGIILADQFTRPVFGMYQPNQLQYVRWYGKEYLITANQGAAEEYSEFGFRETKRGREFDGRLIFSAVDGKNERGAFEEFCTYGGRGFSVWQLPSMNLVYDSGCDFENLTQIHYPDLFNNPLTGFKYDATVPGGKDATSPDKGPEPSTVSVQQMKNSLLIFVGNRNPGTVFVYSVGPGRMEPRFETIVTGIPTNTSKRIQDLFQDRELYDAKIPYIRYP